MFIHSFVQLVQVMSLRSSVGLSVSGSVCPVYCGKTADWIWMPFGVVGRYGSKEEASRQGWRSPHGKGQFGVNVGCPIVTNGDFVA